MLKWIVLILMVTFSISQADEVIIGYCTCEEAVTMESMTMAPGHLEDCTGILKNDENAESGEYMIYPNDGNEAFLVYCDMDIDGGGWTVFQRRKDGSVDFNNRRWSDYKSGFGDVNGEHWLGNDKIHRFSSSGSYELRIDMTSFEDESRYAKYDDFRVDDEDGKYNLTIGTFNGTVGDSLSYHNHQAFTTYDQDNDQDEPRNCAVTYKGGWWYKHCYTSYLNGIYWGSERVEFNTGIIWSGWNGLGYSYSLKTTEMKMRRL